MENWFKHWLNEWSDLLGLMFFFLVAALFFKGCALLS